MEATQTVQYHRHETRRLTAKAVYLISAVLMDSPDDLDLDMVRVHMTEAVYKLAGEEGLSKEEQVSRLGEAIDIYKTVEDSLTAQVEVAEGDSATVLQMASAALDAAVESLTSGKALAAERDFEAHQTEKGEFRENLRKEYEAQLAQLAEQAAGEQQDAEADSPAASDE